MATKVELISQETIKPSSPTPDHLRIFNLSFLDQIMLARYVQTVHFYPNNFEFPNKCQLLKTSLSNVLTHFYPLAGRIKQNMIVECNDDGIEFFEARVHGFLSDAFKNPSPDSLKQFFPVELNSIQSVTGPLLLVQATFFDCGGLAIGISISHKIADGLTLSNFIKAWSATALGCMAEALRPGYVVGSVFPSSKDYENKWDVLKLRDFKCRIVTRRLVLSSSKIADLKAKSASATTKPPTRVEAVTALIWKCLTKASRRNLGTVRPSLMSQQVDMRRRLVPPLPKNSAGNVTSNFIVQMDAETPMDLGNLTTVMRKGLQEFSHALSRNLEEGNFIAAVSELWEKFKAVLKDRAKDFHIFTSWCRFSLYESDFGWGKPKWVALPSFDVKDVVTLMDTRDGEGIEAWISLSEDDMGIVERDEELLEFGSFNPCIVE